MSAIINGNKATVEYLVNSMVDAIKNQKEVERWILKGFMLDVVKIKIKQKELSC
jgi:hypothetical protein